MVNGWLISSIYIYTYLVGGVCIPLKNDGVRQLGLWPSQLNGNYNKMFQTTNQRNVDLTWFHQPWRFKYQRSKLMRLHGDVWYAVFSWKSVEENHKLYPLVSSHITLESHQFSWVNQQIKWQFSSSQTVSLPEGNIPLSSHDHPTNNPLLIH